ncbi:MAG: WecB/TagA/CpsF family glycosyltransferase [Candidatus Doudnabacteria bacterium]|nr:WecB/TagA/CpsF family glycosyltransferase [Candidatus Doudnabacteria bacterium]
MLREITIAGLRVAAETRGRVLAELTRRLDEGLQTSIITPYSEFLHASLTEPKVKRMLNEADVSIPDGVGMLWAQTFLARPLTVRLKPLRTLQATLQMISTGAQILLNPKSIYKTIPEKIVGADFFWDLVKLAEQRGDSIFLLGGYGKTTSTVARILKNKYPKLAIAGLSSTDYPGTQELIEEITRTKSKYIFVAWGPIRQEQWILDNLKHLPEVKLAIGLGATFDYVAGTKKSPPRFIRQLGLEWLFRLITQPYRYKRIYNATIRLILLLIKYKVTHVDAHP